MGESDNDLGLDPSPGFTVEAMDEASRTAVSVRLGELSVVLRERDRGTIQLDPGTRESGGRRATGTHDWEEALEVAEEHLREELDRQRGSEEAREAAHRSYRELTLKHLISVYWEERYPELTESEQTNMELVVDLADAIWGLGTLVTAIDKRHIREFLMARIEEGVSFPERLNRQDLPPVKPVTAQHNLEDFGRITSHAADRRLEDGTALLEMDPLASIDWPDEWDFERDHEEPVPEEVHFGLLEPWTDPRTGEEFPPPVDRVDPSGLLRTLLQVHFLTGHRAASIRNLLVGHVLTSVRDIRAALRDCGGVHRASWAEVFAEHGALYWAAETDKQSYERVTPISRYLRPVLDAHLDRLPSRAPDAPLFPSPRDPSKPIGETTLVRTRCFRQGHLWKLRKGGWVTEAMYLLRAQLAVEGRDPDKLMPLDVSRREAGGGKATLPWKLKNYRDRYATMLDRLGYGRSRAGEDRVNLDRHGDFLGGWSILDRDVKEERYVELDPTILKAAADFVPAMEALQHRAETQAGRLEERMATQQKIEQIGPRTGPEGDPE